MIINFESLGGGSSKLSASAFTDVVLNTSASTLDFYNINGDLVEQFDASSLIIDGMVEDVYLSGNTLVIDFNTESGKQDIEIDLTDFFNPEIYWTSAQTQSAIENATEDFVTSADVETQITDKGYITGYTETDPVFTGSPAYGITSQDINDWDSKLDASALTPYYTSAQTQSAITEATANMVESEDNSVVNVIKISQADYDALVAQSATSTTTLYIIV